MTPEGYFEYGKDGTRQPVNVSMPEVYFDDAPAPELPPERGDVDRLRVFIAVLKDGRRHTMPARLAALEYVFGLSSLTMRQAAELAGCELKTFFDAVRRIRQQVHLSKPEPTTTSRQ
jgi:hypothetical protein